MDTARASSMAVAPLTLVLIAGGSFWLFRSLTASEDAWWPVVFCVPALVVLTLHTLVLAVWQRVDRWRVRRCADSALGRADPAALRRAAARVAEAEWHWPGIDLWDCKQAVEITRKRMEH